MSWCDVFSPCITIHPLEVDVTSGGFFVDQIIFSLPSRGHNKSLQVDKVVRDNA